MNIRDPTNITGISKLFDYNGRTNLADLEKRIIDDINEKSESKDDVGAYKQQLEILGEELGVDLGGGGDVSDNNRPAHDNDDTISMSTNGTYQDHIYIQSYTPHNNISQSAYPAQSSYPSHQTYQPQTSYNNVPSYNPSTNTYMAHVTAEQKKQSILNHVLSGVEDKKFSVEKEKEEDDKAILLEQVDMLITNLKDEGIDVSRVPEVNSSSPIEDIENVHKILRLKNDRNRYCSFAEECILAGSHTLEWLFDGQKTYMGKSPDLRGWSATVNIKLRRMRFDTSTFVSEVMQDYNLGHGTRILLELIPSLFLYSKMKKSQYADNLITSDEMNSAIDRIREIEGRSK